MTNSKQQPIFFYIGLASFILFFFKIELAWYYPSSIFKYIALLSLTIHLCLSIQKYDIKQLLVIAAVALLVIYTGINAHEITRLSLSFALIVGAKDIDFKSILKVCFLTGFSLCLISLVGSSIGLIENKVISMDMESMEMMGSSNAKRYSYGYGWPTGCAIHISFVCLIYWAYKEGLLKWREIISFLCAFWIVYYYNQARQAAIIILLMVVISFYLLYLHKRNKRGPRFLMFLLISSIPLFAIVSIIGTILYDESDILWIAANIIFSNRLKLGYDAIEEYGFRWFGQYFEMIGGDTTYEYNYVDSSYVQMYLLWGIVLTTFLLVLYFAISLKAYKRGDMALLFAIMLAGLSSVTSQYLFQIMSCPFLLALFAKHSVRDIDINKNKYSYVKERRT